MKAIATSKLMHFVALLLILSVGLFTFFAVSGSRQLQLLVGIMTAVSYVAWGLIHHAAHGELYRKVVVEYILIGIIAIVLLVTIVGY